MYKDRSAFLHFLEYSFVLFNITFSQLNEKKEKKKKKLFEQVTFSAHVCLTSILDGPKLILEM